MKSILERIAGKSQKEKCPSPPSAPVVVPTPEFTIDINDVLLFELLDENMTNRRCSDIVYSIMKDQYPCVGVENGDWYIFRPMVYSSALQDTMERSQSWLRMGDQEFAYRRIIMRDIPERLGIYSKYLETKKTNLLNSLNTTPVVRIKPTDKKATIDQKAVLQEQSLDIKGRIKQITEQIKHLKASIDKCQDQTFISKTISQLHGQRYVPKFQEQLDANPYLIGCKNGVYDLKKHQFRAEIAPEDYISKFVLAEYKTYTMDDPIIKRICAFIQAMFQQPKEKDEPFSLYDVMRYLLGNYLVGNNKDERFYVWLGKGRNGKSKLLELMINVLGRDYSNKVPIDNFTNKNPHDVGNGPDITLQGMMGQRMIYSEECDKGAVINLGYLKSLSGGDNQEARGMYERQKEGNKITGKITFLTNYAFSMPPHVNTEDKSVWDRMVIIPFQTYFYQNENDHDSSKYRFQRDTSISEQIKSWTDPFFWLLTQWYKEYTERCLDQKGETYIPMLNIMKNEIKMYQEDNDIFLDFINEHTTNQPYSEDLPAMCRLSDLWEAFIYKRSVPKDIKQKNLAQYLECKGFTIKTDNTTIPKKYLDANLFDRKQSRNLVYGIRLVNENESGPTQCLLDENETSASASASAEHPN